MNFDIETQKIIDEQIELLPDNIKKAIIDFDWQSKILKIGKRHRLQIDEMDAFHKETLLVIIGNQSMNDYSVNLQRELGISKEKANNLIEDTNKEIFSELFSLVFDDYKSDDEEKSNNNLPSHEEILEEVKSKRNSVNFEKTLEKEKFEKIIIPTNETINQSITKKNIDDIDPYREQI